MENTLWKRLWTCRQTNYAVIGLVFVCVSCSVYVYVFAFNSRQLHFRIAVLVSTERSPTNGKNDYVQNFPSQIFLQPPLVLNQPAESTCPWRRLSHGYHGQQSRELNGWRTEWLQWRSWDGDVHVHYSTIKTWKGCGYAGFSYLESGKEHRHRWAQLYSFESVCFYFASSSISFSSISSCR